jgi:MoxR-like ATPase
MSTFVLPFVLNATKKFVKADPMREALSLALVSGRNVIFYGPGGHAKSEMIDSILAAITGCVSHTQMCGEGMDEAKLFGGIDLAAVNDVANPQIRYRTANSFLNWDLVVFEELFDAAVSALKSMKDTMTSGFFRNGEEVIPMRTRLMICATNKEPHEVSELGASAQALVERFPLQLRVAWESYRAADYLELLTHVSNFNGNGGTATIEFAEILRMQDKAKKVVVPDQVRRVLAELIASTVAGGAVVSPRTAIYAVELIKAAAAINGRETAEKQDILAVKYLPGLESIAEKIAEEIKAADLRAQAQVRLDEIASEISQMQKDLYGLESPIKCNQIAKKCRELRDELGKLAVPDGLIERRNGLRDTAEKLSTEAIEKSLAVTH